MTPTPRSRSTPASTTNGIGLDTSPHSSEAERTVLGALLIDPNAVIPVADVLKPDDFYDPTHRLVFQAVCDLYQAHEPIDFITVSVRLAQSEKIQSLGGSAFLAELASSVPTSAHAVHYARIVRDKSMHRRLGDFARAVTGLAVDEKLSAEEALERAEQMLLALSRDRADARPSHVSEVASDSYDRYARLFAEGEDSGLAGLQTGFRQLDAMLAGLPRGAFVVVAARPSMGKSSLALDIARHAAAVQKKTVCFFSLETTKEEIMDRTIAGVLGVEAWRLKKGEITQREFDALGPFFDELKKHPLYLDDDPDTSIANLRGKARRQKLEHGLDLLVIDYLQLIEVTDPAAGENRTQQVSHISRSLKNLARVLGCPVIALSQLSRAVEQRNPPIPILSDLRESGGIEQDSDVVLMLYREDYYNEDCANPGTTDVFVRKNRHGPTGKVSLFFDKAKMSFRDLSAGSVPPRSHV